jgi:hypothetical protein
MKDVLNQERRRLLGPRRLRAAHWRRNPAVDRCTRGRQDQDQHAARLVDRRQPDREVVAKNQGYFEQEGIDFDIQPGGPSIDGVAVVASGRFELGQVSSSPSLMLAVSQGLPIKCFAVACRSIRTASSR